MAHRSPTQLYGLAMGAAHMTQKKLAEALGASERSGQRWGAGSFPSYHLPKLAAIVYPRDAKLAAEIAEAAGGTLESLGIVKPAPKAPPLPPASIVDAVVCAAAEAIDLPPGAVRPAILAAFARAQELGLSLDFVQETLSVYPRKPAPRPPTPPVPRA